MLKIFDDADLIQAVNKLAGELAIANQRRDELMDGMVKLANACESLERALSDRMDIIEGRLDEMKPKEPGEAISVGGHKRWTARRDERIAKHFNAADFVSKLQKATTEVANG
jgi:hypothetical protein